MHEAQEKRKPDVWLGWMEAKHLLEKGEEVVKQSAQIKMPRRPTQLIGVKLIKGDCKLLTL